MEPTLIRRASALLLGSALSWPALSLACPVCFNSRDENRLAFFWTAMVLSVLPLGLIGGALFWVWRRAHAADAGPPVDPSAS